LNLLKASEIRFEFQFESIYPRCDVNVTANQCDQMLSLKLNL